ncbi:MAG: Na+/H+ antiporter NhaA [Pseudomonadota bacterium]
MKLPFVKPRSALREFLGSEASGGLLLMAAAALALVIANSPWAADYFALIHRPLGPMTVHGWINDALMALFFLLVGLEIKREMVDGHLGSWPDRRLPINAAASGMLVPALVYLAVTRGQPELLRGWAIPAATDIAFAIAVLGLLGSRIPASLKLFLTTVAIADDMGAVAIIALAYTATISGPALLAALVILAALLVANRAGLRHSGFYYAGFALLWFAVLKSGVHPTVAGVLAALTIPVRVTPAAPDAGDSTLHRIEHALQKPVAWVIIPLFGFANAGVSLSGASPLSALPLAITLGLLLGKQVGVLGGVWLSAKFKLATPPNGATWWQVYGTALLCGIGFTMSLFIGTLAFDTPTLTDQVKIGVLAGSILSAVAGYTVLRFSSK